MSSCLKKGYGQSLIQKQDFSIEPRAEPCPLPYRLRATPLIRLRLRKDMVCISHGKQKAKQAIFLRWLACNMSSDQAHGAPINSNLLQCDRDQKRRGLLFGGNKIQANDLGIRTRNFPSGF